MLPIHCQHTMFPGKGMVCIERWGVALPAPYLHQVEFWLVYADQGRPSSGNSIKCVKMKTNSAAALLISHKESDEEVGGQVRVTRDTSKIC